MKKESQKPSIPMRNTQRHRAVLHAPLPGPRRANKPQRFLPLFLLALTLTGAFCFLCFGGENPVSEEEPYTFSEPLIEEAVRIQLGIPEGDITYGQLKEVTSLHIFGKQVYTDEAQFLFQGNYVFSKDAGFRESGLWEENGQIESLADLNAMPNLTEACIYRQNITDIEELKGTQIPYLGLGYNPLTDLSPLKDNANIQGINLSCLPELDYDTLATLSGLSELIISGMGEEDLSPLSHLPLRTLNISDTWFTEDATVLSFTGLEKIVLSNLYPDLLSYLKELPIRDLETTRVQGLTLRDLQALPLLQRLCYRTGQETLEELTGEPLSFPELIELDMKGLAIESLTCLSELHALERVGIYESQIQSYEGLESLPSLTDIWALPEQKEQLNTLYPENTWQIG